MAESNDNIVWHHKKIKEYFDNCYTEVYKPFLDVANDFITALMAYVNDDEHSGPEADSSKFFVNDWQVKLIIDTSYMINILIGMMQSGKTDEGEAEFPILDHFLDYMEEEESAIIKTNQLKDVIEDFARYNRIYQPVKRSVDSIPDEVEKAVADCYAVTQKKYTHPDGETSYTRFNNFTSTDGTTGFVPEYLDKFIEFTELHDDDISGSTFELMYNDILSNIQQIIDGLGDGSFDITRFLETRDTIDWKNPREEMSEQEKEDYTAYMKNVAGNHGCNVHAYDPVNVNNGNYVSDKTDLLVGGRHQIRVGRYYNANVDRSGILGKGWTSSFEVHLTKKDDRINILYRDGREGEYKKKEIGGKEFYFEFHGDSHVLTKEEDGYILKALDNSFFFFDNDGYLVSVGDDNGVHTEIEYDTVNVAIGSKNIIKAIPVLVKTKEGNFVKLSYDKDGNLLKAMDHTGREVSYEYETVGDEKHLICVTFPNGSKRKYTYNKDGVIDTSVRPDGITAVINEYDSMGRISHQTMPDGGVLTYSYDEKNHVTTVIEPNGNKVEYVSDELGRNIKTRYPELGIEEKFAYNDRNQKISHTDKNGFTTRYTYDNNGRLTSVIGPEGFHEFYTYNSDGKLTSLKDSEGNVTKFKYDLEGNLCSAINPYGVKIKFDYVDGKVVSIRDAENKKTNLTYDVRGNIASITDPNGVTTKYECDSLGRVIATTDADGNRTTYDIGVDNNLKRVVDPEGNVTAYEYNSLGKVSAITNPDGTKKTWEYNSIGKPSVFTDEDNRTTRVYYNLSSKEERIILPNNGNINYEYDLLGNLTKVTDPDGIVTSYTHDKAGNVITIKKADKTSDTNADDGAVVSSYTYDGLGRVKTHTDGNGNVLSYEYNTNGNITKVTAPNGAVTRREYDKVYRLIKEIDACGREKLYTYDKNGNIKTATDTNGVVTENTYENNRLVKVVKKAGEEEQLVACYEYDACGRISTEIQSDGYTLKYDYTKNGQISRVTDSNGRSVSYKYDACGRVSEFNDAGMITRNEYTRTGKLKSVTDAHGNKTKYTYNELDLICKVERFGEDNALKENDSFPKVDNKGHVTVYEHSLAGNLLSITDALGQKDIYTYDVLGNVKSHIDRDGFETVFTRDNNGNVTGVNYADGKSVKMSYNALNILQEVKDHLGITKIERDILGRVVSVTDYKGRTVGYEYGPYDHESAIIYPDGKRAEYKYDAFGRLERLLDGTADKPITYTYDATGRLSGKSFPNGVKTAFEYYQGGLLKSMISTDTQGIIDRYVYNYEKETALVSEIERSRRGMDAISGTYHYEYDDLRRLTKSTLNGNLRAEYKYDAFGNRTEMIEADTKTSYEYDALDRLTRSIVRDSSNNETCNIYSYDRRGNQVALTSGDILKKTFKYDAMGRMTHATDAEKGDISYTYNGLGYRVESERPEERIEYLCDLSKDYYNLLERTINGETESFVYDNNVVSMNRGGSNFYYLQDELGSPMYLTGTDGLTVDAYAYDDFGRRVDPYTGKLRNRLGKEKNSHTYKKVGNIIQPFVFIGYQEDEVSELNYAQARYYDPNAGRFNSEDNNRGYVETPETLNHYEYCWNNPLDFVDLDGNWGLLSGIKKAWADNKEKIIGAAVNVAGIVAGAAVQVGVTALCAPLGPLAPVVGGAVGGAVSGAISNVGSQIAEGKSLKEINLKEVAVSAAVGGISGAVGGVQANSIKGRVIKVASQGIADGVGDLVTNYVKDGKLDSSDFKSAVKTGLLSMAFSSVGEYSDYKSKQSINNKTLDGAENLDGANAQLKEKYDKVKNDMADTQSEIDKYQNWAENGQTPNQRKGAQDKVDRLQNKYNRDQAKLEDLDNAYRTNLTDAPDYKGDFTSSVGTSVCNSTVSDAIDYATEC